MRIPRFVAYLFVMIFSISAQAKTEKYRCMWKYDPSTSMVVAWNQVSGKSPILYLDTIARKDVADFAWNFQVSKKKRYKRMNNHFVRLHDLKPDKVYYFIIKDSNSESQVMSVRTLPDSKEEQLSIIAGGDSRNHRKYRQNANLLVSKLRPHFVLFGG
ncbi:MAG: fibronectin type III domain-containing protein, partial [Saprospiraceae bacterium]